MDSMSPLKVTFEKANDGSIDAVFSNELTEFSFSGIDASEYYGPSDACLSGTDIGGKELTFSVKNGIVAVRINGDYYPGEDDPPDDPNGYIAVFLPAAACANAFMEAYDELTSDGESKEKITAKPPSDVKSPTSPLAVEFKRSTANGSMTVVFSNELTEFNLGDIEITDYIEAARACSTGSDWESDRFKVEKGTVAIWFNGGYADPEGYVKVFLPAAACVKAFERAAYELALYWLV